SGYEGENFDDEWAQAQAANPTFVILKSWNEWISYRLNGGFYTDEYSPDFSNDLEPAASGFGSYYLTRLAPQIQLYKRNSPNLPFYNAADGTWYFKDGRGGAQSAAQNFTHSIAWPGAAHAANYQPVMGDFDDDGKTDIGYRDPTSGKWT